MMNRIDLNFDPVTWDDDLRLQYRDEPFTGEVVETAAGQLLSQSFYVDGISHGPVREWWADGRLKSEGEMKRGVDVGIFRSWHHNGRLKSEIEFSDDGTPLSRRDWDEEGNFIPRRKRRAGLHTSDG
jgi:antitoxin component YwqK of YwqJK toxin-antitoxin module